VLFSYALLILNQKDLWVVDLRSRLLAFRGAGGEPPRRFAPLGVSPVPLIPQESRPLRSNQLVKEHTLQKNVSKQQSFRNERNKKISGWLISAPGCSLSAGRAVSLLPLCAIRSLTCPTRPAGVSHLVLQSTSRRSILFKNVSKQQSFRSERNKKISGWLISAPIN
jgi:hypothetical protein